jgi:hypothetical protein
MAKNEDDDAQRTTPIGMARFASEFYEAAILGLRCSGLNVSKRDCEFRHVTVSVLAVFVDTVNHTDKVAGFQWTL